MPKSPDAEKWLDGLFDFSMGMDSGVQPLLLQRNQAAFITNGTVRDTFLTQRPAVNRITLNYNGDADLQAGFETGLFQGGCFYNPDFGNQCLMAAVAGRLFQFSISGSTATVTEQTIPGDPNPPTRTQAWMWQAENYVIWNDGLSLPVFYNGQTSRRSFGAQVLLATSTAGFTAPDVGATASVVVDAPYTGPINIPVEVGSAFYQLVSAGAVYDALLTNQSDTAGNTVAAGTQIVSEPSVMGVLNAPFPPSGAPGNYPANGFINGLTLTLPFTLPGGTQFNLFGATWQVIGLISPDVVKVENITPVTIPVTPAPVGTLIPLASNTQPNVVVGTLVNPFVVPAVGSPVTVTITAPYVGADNQPVFLGTGQYTIVAAPNPPPNTTITLINSTDVSGTSHAPAQIFSIPELPPGRMGTYGMGRNWECLVDGKSFIASDIVGGSSGTQPNGFRDSVLKITENTYLAGGGVFQVPGSIGDIRAMVFTSILDMSMGQGPLQVFTPNTVFSCNAPVDRTKWQAITNPILTESLIGNGGLGQNSTIPCNGDTFFRSVDGVRSLILGQRQFSTWGNVPLSIEMDRLFNADNTALLNYSTAAVFNNRLVFSAAPVAGPQGVFHEAAGVLNFDPVRSVDEKSQPVYDGMWTGVNVLQYITGIVNGVQRMFAFTYNAVEKKLEVYEFLTDIQANFDNGVIPITWSVESASLFKDIKGKGPFDLCRLIDGELYIDDLIGRVTFQVFYKSDQYPCWTPWYSWQVCAVAPNPLTPTANDADIQPQFRQRMGFGIPDATVCDPNTGFALREGCTFQLKIVVNGCCRILGVKLMAVAIPDTLFAKPICAPIC